MSKLSTTTRRAIPETREHCLDRIQCGKRKGSNQLFDSLCKLLPCKSTSLDCGPNVKDVRDHCIRSVTSVAVYILPYADINPLAGRSLHIGGLPDLLPTHGEAEGSQECGGYDGAVPQGTGMVIGDGMYG